MLLILWQENIRLVTQPAVALGKPNFNSRTITRDTASTLVITSGLRK